MANFQAAKPYTDFLSFLIDFLFLFGGLPSFCTSAKSALEGPSGRRLSAVSVASSDKEYLYSPLDGMPVHRRVPPALFAGTHLYTWVERGTMKVKCLAQEHNTMSPARTQTLTTRSGVERTNHQATRLPYLEYH